MSYFRTPSPLEFTYLATDRPDYSPLVNQLAVVGEGDIDCDRLQAALDQALQANPGLNLRLKGRWGWRNWDDRGHRPRVTEIHAPHWHSDSSVAAPCLGDPINPRTDPVCQLAKIHAANGTHLLFRLHHAVTDGRGCIHLMNDVFRILRGEVPLGSTSSKSEWEIAMAQERPPRPVVEGNCLPVVKGTLQPDRRGYQWYRFDWTGNKNKLAAKLVYAAASIARLHFGEGKCLFRIPADLRRYLDESEGFTVANCTGAIDLEVGSEADVNSIRLQMVRALRQKEDISPFMDNHRYARWLPRSAFLSHPKSLAETHRKQRYRMSGIISYMGDLNIDLFSCDGFRPTSQFGVPIPFENRPLIITAGSSGHTTHIVIACPQAVATLDELKGFGIELSRMLDRL